MRRVPRVAILLALLASGCAAAGRPATPGPGAPKVWNLQFDPPTVRVGEAAILRFEFEAPGANLAEIFLFVNRVGDWGFTAGLSPTRLSAREVSGVAVGEVATPVRPCLPVSVSLEPGPEAAVSGGRDFAKRSTSSRLAEARCGLGTLFYEVFVVDEKGNESNRLRNSLTVRP